MSLSTSAKFLAWFGMVNGVFTVATPILTALPFPSVGFIIYLCLGLASFIGGFYGLRAQKWAFWLLFTTFLIQCAEYISKSFFFSFIGPLSLKFGLTWNTPPSQINLNIMAIIICILSVRTAVRLTGFRGGKIEH